MQHARQFLTHTSVHISVHTLPPLIICIEASITAVTHTAGLTEEKMAEKEIQPSVSPLHDYITNPHISHAFANNINANK